MNVVTSVIQVVKKMWSPSLSEFLFNSADLNLNVIAQSCCVRILVVFTHAVAIFVIGGVFDRTGPDWKLYNKSVLSEGSPCIGLGDGLSARSALIERESLVGKSERQDLIPGCLRVGLTYSTVIPPKRSSDQRSPVSAHQSSTNCALSFWHTVISSAVCDIDKQRGARTLYFNSLPP
jgi:hypothetical protein